MKGIKEIIVERYEGPVALLKGPVSVQTWLGADLEIRRIARSVPDGGGYDKTGVTVVFEDGKRFRIRYDVEHKHRIEADTRKECLHECGFYSGQWRPGHMSAEVHEQLIREIGEKRAQYAEAYRRIQEAT